MAKSTTTSGKAKRSAPKDRKAAEDKAEKARTTQGKAAAKPTAEKKVAKATAQKPANGAKGPASGTKAASTESAAKGAKGATPKTSTTKAANSSGAKSSAAKPSAAKPSAAKPSKGADTKKPAGKSVPAANRPWLKNYPDGIPGEIAPFGHNSIADLLVDSCHAYATRPAFTSMDKTITYAELERLSARFGAWLQSKGLEKGARVALMMPNVLQFPIAMMAVLRAGYVVVNVNPLYTARELEHQLNDSGAEAIVILENFAGTLEAVAGKTPVKHVVVASMGDLMGLKGLVVNFVVRRVKKLVPAWSLPGHVTFKDALKTGESLTFAPAECAHDDVAFLQYTGGTTGVSKGAALTHRNVLANVAQNALWVEAIFRKRKRPEQLVYICALPLYHIFALTVNALMGMREGGHNVLIANPRDIPAFVKDLKKYRFHIFPGLNTLFNALLNNEAFRKVDFSGLILTVGGGMAVQRSVAERWKKLTGSTISEGYGLSETAPVATANRFDGGEFTGTIGLPLPSTEVAIRDEKGKDVAIGKVGEICIRGPQVMAGYWNRPDETEKVMTKDGFFRSGDMGTMDEGGYIKIVDRKKDMILVSGFNVYPNEIEDVVSRHPGVLEVAAVGVPDEHSGEVPKLFVVRKDENLTEQDLIDYCKDKLTGYKRPRHVEFRKELPKTNVGKVLRRELR